MAEVRIARVENKYGVRVKRCCASCLHKRINEEGERCCALTRLLVGQKQKCDEWKMGGVMNAGKGGGDVRHKDTKEVLF